MAQKSDMRGMGEILAEAKKNKSLGVERILTKFVKKANTFCTTTFTRRGDGTLEQKQEWSKSTP